MLRQDRLLARRQHWRSVLAALLAGCVAHGQADTARAAKHADQDAPAREPQVLDQPAPAAQVLDEQAPATQVLDQDARTAALRTTVILKIAPYITAEGKGRRCRIGVVGTDAVATAALRELPGKKVEQASVTVGAVEPKVAASGAAARDFDLLWIAASVDDTTLQRIVAAHASRPVLLVCERSGFAALGGGLQLFARGDCMRFELNAEALRQQGLRPSAQLLKLSRKGPCR